MITIAPIPAFNDNYIWHLQQGSDHWVVDPGDAGPVISALGDAQLTGILITHHHYDHTGGIESLVKRYQCPVFGPDSIPDVSDALVDGDQFELLGGNARVLAVPGHTLDHIAIFLEHAGDTYLFCGDTLFAAGCGRLFEGSPEQMYRSLQSLAALPKETRVYCAHEYTVSNLHFALAAEPDNTDVQARLEHARHLRDRNQPTVPSTIAEELATNPFLRCESPTIRQQAKARETRADSSPGPVDVFATLRAWKDNF
ncbi:hydroxyacylglutathione hydrolase [Microbulbifer sp.]|uniref:hydroxyacylglutathione hydrolase n=1 Tax=Microbulbifer sp. TaxID=1908541 RepID=UPI00258A2B30|nr:hydroxyacylglutathione hydrolase [Microbulbifer sp.]